MSKTISQNNKIKTSLWILIIAILFAISLAASLFLYFHKSAGTIANIYVDGKCIMSIDLSDVTEPYTKTIDCNDGQTNTISVENGKICVIDANCGDLTCVKTGWISESAEPIVCLPHRLVIKLEKKTGTDTLDAVSK